MFVYDENGAPKTQVPTEYRLVPGSLVEAMGPAKLEFAMDEDVDSMLLLTADYEQGYTAMWSFD